MSEFKKELTEEDKKEILDILLTNFSFENQEKGAIFYDTVVSYVSSVRRDIPSLKANIKEIIELFFTCGYSEDEIIDMICKEPSILHEDKNNIFWKLLMFGKIMDTNTGRSIRESGINPRDFRISLDLMYARIKYLSSPQGDDYLRHRTNFLTKRMITKVTNEEFLNSYGISKEDLIRLYPFDNDAQIDVISWPENETFLENISKYNETKKGLR